jgi:signal transduction histidine kinase
MAREIHDTLGHYLTILAVKLETATRLEEHGDPRLAEELREARRIASECLAEVRHSVTALRPADPTAASLARALGQLVREFEAAAPDVEVTLDLEGDIECIAPEVRLALYRCAQEALTNVRKHAQASNVLLRVRTTDDVVELTVLDNGLGRQEPVTAEGSGAQVEHLQVHAPTLEDVFIKLTGRELRG